MHRSIVRVRVFAWPIKLRGDLVERTCTQVRIDKIQTKRSQTKEFTEKKEAQLHDKFTRLSRDRTN